MITAFLLSMSIAHAAPVVCEGHEAFEQELLDAYEAAQGLREYLPQEWVGARSIIASVEGRSCIRVDNFIVIATHVWTSAMDDDALMAACPDQHRIRRRLHRLWKPLARIDRNQDRVARWMHPGEPEVGDVQYVADPISHAAWRIRERCNSR